VSCEIRDGVERASQTEAMAAIPVRSSRRNLRASLLFLLELARFCAFFLDAKLAANVDVKIAADLTVCIVDFEGSLVATLSEKQCL
jgi:hypothetical protein